MLNFLPNSRQPRNKIIASEYTKELDIDDDLFKSAIGFVESYWQDFYYIAASYL